MAEFTIHLAPGRVGLMGRGPGNEYVAIMVFDGYWWARHNNSPATQITATEAQRALDLIVQAAKIQGVRIYG